MNSKLGMIAYGIIDKECELTDFGHQLYTIKDKSDELYSAFAKHILTNLNGMNFVQCIQDMVVSGTVVNLTSLRDSLAERGVHYPSGGKHPSIMRLWLSKAGVFIGTTWMVDEAKLQQVLGISSSDFGVLGSLTSEQRAFIKALSNTGVLTPQPSNEIAKLASVTYGVKFPEKSLPKLVLDDLVAAGYITITKTTSGRGAKPFLVQPTKKLQKDLIEPLLDQLVKQTDPKLRPLLKKSLAEILVELKSTNKHVAGLALEALGFKLMRILDIDYLATRLRGTSTGGAEVDIIFQSTRLIYSRWQIQCKNTSRVSLDDVAKEVGLTHFLKSNAIVIVSTGKIGSEARRYANKVMSDSNLAIIMLDENDLEVIKNSPPDIVEIFDREARHAMSLKTLVI